jgi:aminoglycoside phosphotransferase (APT) family kinase protein
MEHNKMKFYLAILSFIPGKEFYACIRELNQSQQGSIAKDILSFLTEMHAIRANHYDIGFYIPTIPKFTGSWIEGHKHYIQWLLNQIKEIELDANLHSKVRQAFKYIDEHIESLEFQSGPVYLHNDLHPKNIIIQDYNFSGVIDYECAQYGERDFDLVHLVHWSLFPPDARSHFNEMVQFIIDVFQKQSYIPELDIRLTIYQLQHEINQIIWNPNQNLQERKTRIDKWLEGVIYQTFFKDH